MAFFQLDDQLTVNAKMRRLTEGSLVGDLRGMAAQALWAQAGTLCQASLTDGVVSRVDTIRLLLNPALADELAGLLVDAGLWHAPGHDCSDCDPVPDSAYRFHQWWQFGYGSADQVKAARAKRAELKDADLRDAVWLRDCLDPASPNDAACRYCGRHVNRKNGSSKDLDARPALDHVDPSKATGVENLVVACSGCNREKGQRTPAQAGMTLRPAPRPAPPTLAVSPPQGAAGTPQSPLASSPPTGAAEEPQSHPRGADAPHDTRGLQGPAGRLTGTAGSSQSKQEQGASTEQPESAVHGRTRAGAGTGAGGAGTGQGHGSGRGAGEGEGSPRSRRSRRRGRGKPRPDQRPAPPTDQGPPAQVPSWDAGPAPQVVSPGRFGSPWHGWTGKPGDDAPETRCQHHPGEHLPCRRCREES